jgi:hypothetical protein
MGLHKIFTTTSSSPGDDGVSLFIRAVDLATSGLKVPTSWIPSVSLSPPWLSSARLSLYGSTNTNLQLSSRSSTCKYQNSKLISSCRSSHNSGTPVETDKVSWLFQGNWHHESYQQSTCILNSVQAAFTDCVMYYHVCSFYTTRRYKHLSALQHLWAKN